jgi:hypothetical protein
VALQAFPCVSLAGPHSQRHITPNATDLAPESAQHRLPIAPVASVLKDGNAAR